MKQPNIKNLSIFLLPSMILAFIFIFYPIVNTIILSFVNSNGDFVGFANYKYLFTSEPLFQAALKTTFIYTISVTVIEMLIALIIAFLLTQKIKFKNTFQTIFFLPYVTSVVAIGSVFRYMFHSQYGVINQWLFNGSEIQWLSDPHLVIISMIILGVWKGLAFNILILFTGLSTTNQNVEKAALIDGFSPLGIFTKIKLPQIKPVLIYLLTMNIIFNFKVYEEVVALFPSSVPNGANTLVSLLKDKTLTDKELAATIAVVLLVIVIGVRYLSKLISKIYIKTTNKRKVVR